MGFIEGIHFFSLYSSRVNSSARNSRIINGVKVGKYSFGVENHCNQNSLLESVGAFCSINDNVIIGAGNHPTSLITTHPLLYKKKGHLSGHDLVPVGLLDAYGVDIINDISDYCKNDKITIGNDVWIGSGVIILPSVRIGNGAIIGAGAIVTKDVPDYAIVIGVPAKVIRYRFSEEQINMLNNIKWWSWTDDEIARNGHLLMNPELFFKTYGY